MLSAAMADQRGTWPDGVDAVALLAFAAIAFGLPLLGYCAMAVDIRAYWRSLSRALVAASHAIMPGSPSWARRDRPPCLDAFGLTLPCTEEQVLAAYRQRVKELHPDRGGDLRQFLRLQKHFEQATYLARSRRPKSPVAVK
ncbi:MAG: hypothetical protein DCC67_03030 [Planctomycetota bacterium]|nr:MAG: hypothetical protein DCC67_03030 [Planctomycetota bacterium]